VIVKLAARSLCVRPVRSIVLACGFGLGIAVMAELLGIGEVILEQAQAPALQGSGDLVASGVTGTIDNGRFVLSAIVGSRDMRPRIAAASPSATTTLYLTGRGPAMPVVAKGGVPSLEKALGDAEVQGVASWVDAPGDARWTTLGAAGILRDLDRFHAQPDVPEFAPSWAEWLYFNGRSADGRVRFYLTFLVGPLTPRGTRGAGVRLQLDRGGRVVNFSEAAEVNAHEALESAPDLRIGASRVHLDGEQYRMALRLREEGGTSTLDGQITLDASARRALPPMVIHGARGWLSGYVVPVLSGPVGGELRIGGESVSLAEATGYHDHNWGFWRDVRWQWGQVGNAELSFVYGRVFPPSDVADPERMPGFLGVFGSDGVMGAATNVSIAEEDADGAPRRIDVTARGAQLDVSMAFATERLVRSQLTMTGATADFLQLGGSYRVTGRVGGRSVDFTARGAAETFRRR